MRPVLLFAAATLFAAASAATAVSTEDVFTAPAGNAKLGRATFQRYGCYQCHGTSGEGAGQFGPKLAPDPLPLDAYHHQLRAPRGLMPVYTDKILSEQQVADIYAYLQAVPAAKSPDQIPLLQLR